MVKLRLKRLGKKKFPIYRIVAADARSPRDGRFIEEVGYYNPNPDPMELRIKEDRVLYWLKTGAQPTDTVRSLFQREGIILKWHLEKKGFDENKIEEELEKFHSGKEAKLEREKEKKLRRKKKKVKKGSEQKEESKSKKEEAKIEATPIKEEIKEEATPIKEETKEEATSIKEETKEETTPEIKETKEETNNSKEETKEDKTEKK